MTPHRHLLITALFVAPLAIGSVHTWAVGVVCFLLAASALLSTFGKEKVRIRPSLFLLGLSILVCFTLFQVLPLPPGMMHLLSPETDAVWVGALGLAEAPSSWRTISLDPASTSVELVKLLALVGTFVLCLMWYKRQGHHSLLSVVALVGVVCAVVAILHRLMGIEAVYGLYQPMETVGAWNSAPLLNANHLAGLLALCTPIGIGLGLDTHDRSRRALWFVAAAVTAMAAVASLSRGGIAALALSLGLLVLGIFRKREDGSERKYRVLWGIAGVIVVLVAGAYVALEAVIDEYLSGDTNKFALWSAAWPMIVAYFPFGVGRGAFRDVFTSFDGDLERTAIFTHAESFPVQWSAEWGLIGMIAALALVVALFHAMVRGSRYAAKSGATAGAIGLVAQNFVDFSLELLGVSMLLIATLAVIIGGKRRRSRNRLRISGRIVKIGIVLSLLGGTVVLATTRYDPFGHSEQEIREQLLSETPEFDVATAREAVIAHPSWFMIPYLFGALELRSEAGSGLSWLTRALELNPDYGPTHLWIARSLVAYNHNDQAMLEYRMAAQLDARLVRPISREVVSRWPRFEQLRPLLEDAETPPRELWNAVTVEMSRAGQLEEAALSDSALLAVSPSYVPAAERVARRALKARRHEDAREVAERLDSADLRAVLLHAEVDAASGEPSKAVNRLETALRSSPDDSRILAKLARYRELTGDPEGSREAFDRLEKAVGRSGLSQVLVTRGMFEERSGSDSIALVYYQRAVTLGAGRRALLGVARVAERRGETQRALEALRRLAAQEGSDAEDARARTKALEQRVERQRLEGLLHGSQ